MAITRGVVVDLDGVLYDTLGGVLEYLYTHWGVLTRRETVQSYNLVAITDNSEAREGILKQFRNPKFYENLNLLPGAQTAMTRLAEHLPVHFVTSRPAALRGMNLKILCRDFPNLFRGISHVRPNTKYRVAKDLRARYAVEDHPGIAVNYSENRIRAYLMRTSYMGNVAEGRFLKIAADFPDAVNRILTRMRVEG